MIEPAANERHDTLNRAQRRRTAAPETAHKCGITRRATAEISRGQPAGFEEFLDCLEEVSVSHHERQVILENANLSSREFQFPISGCLGATWRMSEQHKAVSELLLTIAKKRGQPLKSLSIALGKSATYLHNFVHRGSPRRLHEDDRQKLAELLRIDESSLRTGVLVFLDPADPLRSDWQSPQPPVSRETLMPGASPEDPFKAPANLGSAVTVPPIATLPRDVKVLGVAAGGDRGSFVFNGDIVDYVRRPPGLAGASQAFGIYVTGDSMEPKFSPGDLIFVNPARPPRLGDFVVVEMVAERDGAPGPAWLKRLVLRTSTKLVVGQFNPKRDDIELPLAKIKSVFRVTPWTEALGV